MKKILPLAVVAALSITTSLFADGASKIGEIPIEKKFVSTDNGGNISAIDAYSDGVGIFVVDKEGKPKKDNSRMNRMVYKYGAEAKAAGEKLVDYVNDNGTPIEKISVEDIAIVQRDVGLTETYTAGASCDDGDDLTSNDKYIDTDGTCVGNETPFVVTSSELRLFGKQYLMIIDMAKGSSFSFDMSSNFDDPENDTLSFTNSNLMHPDIENMITTINTTTGVLSGTIPNVTAGHSYLIEVFASDDYQTVSINVQINVTEEPAPVLSKSSCMDEAIGSSFEDNGKLYYVVDNASLYPNLNKADRLCTSNVTDMSRIFISNSGFNKDIGYWDTSSVTDMHSMFKNAASFNQNINGWDVGNVTNMIGMFEGANSMEQSNISTWGVDINTLR